LEGLSESERWAARPELQYRHVVVYQSDSDVQREAEPVILAGVSAQLGVGLVPRSLRLPGGARVDVDGAAEDESVFVEVFAHQGRLRGGQFHKVARDALKLITVGRGKPTARLILAFGDKEAAASVTGGSWLAEALSVWKVEVFVVELDDAIRGDLRAAQARQVMINQPVPADS
jgi:hypothetical protein